MSIHRQLVENCVEKWSVAGSNCSLEQSTQRAQLSLKGKGYTKSLVFYVSLVTGIVIPNNDICIVFIVISALYKYFCVIVKSYNVVSNFFLKSSEKESAYVPL